MTLDRAIEYYKSEAERIRQQADDYRLEKEMAADEDKPRKDTAIAVCEVGASDNEQLAKWLTELKAYKEGKIKTTPEEGDLISRDKLKAAFDNLPRDSSCEPIWYDTTVFETIDKAPTVEAYPFEQVQELVALNQQFAKEIENLKRQQGEWEDYSVNFYKCPECGYLLNKDCPCCQNKVILPKGGAE